MLGLSLALLAFQAPVPEARDALRHSNGRVPRTITAVFTEDGPDIDGRLDDALWATIPPESGFRRDVPSDGRPATDDVEVRVAYDADALYVGARLLDSRPELVSRRLNRRDSFSHFNDVFFVLIDSYHDHRTQFVLGVTPAGERRDALGTGDTNAGLDVGWDPVWEARTSVDSLGWVAEMRIPFSQLRFSNAGEQIWGIQFRRDNVRAGEAVDWEWSPRTEPGQVSKYGHLLGLRSIPAPARLEILPYGLSQARLTQGVAPGDPFDDGSVSSLTGGVDLKYGLTSNLTLSATVNPDFGQVESDPSVLNLTAFETFFEERRPFFVEGANVFAFGVGNAQQPRLFYSRRVGRAPALSLAGTAPFVDEPPASSILGAVKVAGRVGGGWSLGVLNALTGREFARTAAAPGAPVERTQIEPLSDYGVLRIRHDEPGGTGGVGFMGTAVHRDVSADRLPILRRSAYAGAVDFFRRWQGNNYQLEGYLGWSRIAGEPQAIALAQLSSARYYQRPDQTYSRFDPTATSLSGTTGELRFNKNGGEWRFGGAAAFVSPGFEINDAGFQLDADRIGLGADVSRQWVRPSRYFRNAGIGLNVTQNFNFGGTALRRDVSLAGSGTLHSFSSFHAGLSYRFHGMDDRATRGGPLIREKAAWGVNVGGSTDSRRAVAVSAGGGLTGDAAGSLGRNASATVTLQTKRGASVSVSPRYNAFRFTRFYLATYADPTATATFATRYVFAQLEQNTLSIATRLNYYFTPALSLQVYAEPFVSTARFGAPAALERPKTFAFQPYGTRGSVSSTDPATGAVTVDADGAGPAPAFTYPNPSFRIRSLRSNVVLRWEYRPGSTIFLVWNQGRFNRIGDPAFRPLHDLGSIFSDDMQNVLLLKMNWHLDW